MGEMSSCLRIATKCCIVNVMDMKSYKFYIVELYEF